MKNIPLTKKEKIAIIAGIGALIIGFFSYLTFAGGNIGVSLNTGAGLGNSLSTGLVGWWTFDGKNMTLNAADSSGTGNTGYLTNFTSTTTLQGKVGQALKFDGVNDEVDIPYNASLDLPNSGGAVSAWFYDSKYEIQNNFSGIYWREPHGNPVVTGGVMLGLYGLNFPGNRLAGVLGASSVDNANDAVFGGTDIAPNTWHHGVLTWTSTTMTLYLDGVQQSLFQVGTGSATSSTRYIPLNWPNAVQSRMGIYGSGGFFKGNVDDVRTYNRTISAAEAKRLYDLGATTHQDVSVQSAGTLAGAPNSNSGLISYWTFDGSKTASNVVDSSGQGNTGYLRSFTATTSVQGKIGQALQFTGTTDYVVGTNVVNVPVVTESIWVKFNTKPASQAFIAGFTNGLGAGQFDKDLYLNTNGTVQWYVYDGAGKGTVGVRDITDGKWHHLVGTANGSISVLYIDGVLDATIAAGNTYTSYTVPNVFVNGANGAGVHVNGSVDDYRVYNYAMSSSTVSRIYQEGVGAAVDTSVQTSSNTGNSLSTGLVGYWTFDGPKMLQNVVDSGPSGYTGYLTNFTSTTSLQGKIGQGLGFSGTSFVNIPTQIPSPNAFTLSGWYKQGTIGSAKNDQIVIKTDNSSIFDFQFYYRVISVANCSVGFRQACVCFDGDGLNASDPCSAVFTDDSNWHHYAVTRSGTTLTFYRDGAVLATTGSVGAGATQNSNVPTRLGGGPIGGSADTFALDDIRIYNRALSAAEVNRLYQLGK